MIGIDKIGNASKAVINNVAVRSGISCGGVTENWSCRVNEENSDRNDLRVDDEKHTDGICAREKVCFYVAQSFYITEHYLILPAVI